MDLSVVFDSSASLLYVINTTVLLMSFDQRDKFNVTGLIQVKVVAV